MNPDGSQQERLTQNISRDYGPVWSPTGEQILFVSDREGISDLYVMDADGSHVRRVFRKSARRTEPTWSPDGKRIAFYAEEPRWSIQTATIHGADVKQVVLTEWSGGYPSWSANGNEIAFVGDVGGTRRILILKLGSGGIHTFLPKEQSWMYSPAWSPEGDKLAFSWYKWGIVDKQAIFIANRDGSGLEQIGKSVPRTSSPAWSPEGDKIVYAEDAKNNNNQQIVVIDVETRGKKQLTRNGSNITPAWFDPKSLSVTPQPHLLTTVWGKIKR
jgi:Tol biopolymer transport system component